MKIAVASDDGVNIARHFGRSKCYVVFEVVDRTIKSSAVVPLGTGACAGHHGAQGHAHGHDHAQAHDHSAMVEPVMDCELMVCGGIGMRAVEAFAMQGVRVAGVAEDIPADEAVRRILDGRLPLEGVSACRCSDRH